MVFLFPDTNKNVNILKYDTEALDNASSRGIRGRDDEVARLEARAGVALPGGDWNAADGDSGSLRPLGQ